MLKNEIEATLDEAVQLGLIWKSPWGYYAELSDKECGVPAGLKYTHPAFVSKEQILKFFDNHKDTFEGLRNSINSVKKGKTPPAMVYNLSS